MQLSLKKPKSRKQSVGRKLRASKSAPGLAIVIHDNLYRERVLSVLSRLNIFKSERGYKSSHALLKRLGECSAMDSGNVVVLMDFQAMGSESTKAIARVLEAQPKARIVVLSYSVEEANVLEAIKLGACGYISKHNDLNEICKSVRDAFGGDTVVDSRVVGYLAKAVRDSHVTEANIDKEITQRQLDVLLLLSEGLQKKEIADRLGLSYHTVAMHTRMIYDRLNVNNASAAVTKALKSGIL